MKSAKAALVVAIIVVALSGLRAVTTATTAGPQYTRDGALQFPEGYREWTYVTSGLDMSYSPSMQMGDQHVFDNLFVNPEAYAAFQQTGTWPDKTTFVLEQRLGQSKGSINQHGSFQTTLLGFDVHVRDDEHFKGRWAFFNFSPTDKSAKMIPATVACYTCHAAHGAVDTTFVQFYPTLLPVAREKGTLARGYLDETAAPAK